MTKVLITGGAGFIGSHIADGFLAKGYEVHVVDNLSGGKRENVPEGVLFHELDILETEKLIPLCKGVDAIFHEAGLPRVQFSIDYPLESNRANVDGTVSVLVAAKEAGVGRVVYAASGSAYGYQTKLPFTEDMEANPVNPYGLQKYIGEMYMKMFAEVHGVSTVSLRYFNVYGPRMDPSGPYGLAIAKFLEQRSQNQPLTIVGNGEQTRDFTHVRDVVRANIAAMESTKVGKGEVINIGTGRNVSVNFLADLVGGTERVMLPERVEAKDALADISRAKELLNWVPEITLEEGINELKQEYHIV